MKTRKTFLNINFKFKAFKAFKISRNSEKISCWHAKLDIEKQKIK